MLVEIKFCNFYSYIHTNIHTYLLALSSAMETERTDRKRVVSTVPSYTPLYHPGPHAFYVIFIQYLLTVFFNFDRDLT